ncbi:hypothetical protein CBR_g19181 [Chara braunii]|uniref:Uncharacterized protein n=1 Tax=Chara braunii TaxID=69332 RepID=A0A388JTG4_CHABU|nr:hypothetical protein CBR_g19181 [Chara braunii]|eukprot:GBG61104.1 hypothetical protein CBR_g19181 [Chara braunii]
MSECNDLFEKGCTQGVLLVKSWGGELPASMVADGHFLLDRPPLPSQAESASTLSMEVSDPLCTMDFVDDTTSTIGVASQITTVTAIPTTISATATIPLCTMGILDDTTSTTGAESQIITATSTTASAPVCITYHCYIDYNICNCGDYSRLHHGDIKRTGGFFRSKGCFGGYLDDI